MSENSTLTGFDIYMIVLSLLAITCQWLAVGFFVVSVFIWLTNGKLIRSWKDEFNGN
jgi:hypothetical protein